MAKSDPAGEDWLLEDLGRPLFQGGPTEDPAMARRWLGVYEALVAATEAQLEESRRRAPGLSPQARRELEDRQLGPLEARLVRLRRRRRHWRRRHAGLVRLDLDGTSGRLSHAGRSVRLSRRECQLLDFLLGHPNRFFVPMALLAQAWHASYLAEEQLRSYVVRLRQKLAQLEAPCQLLNRRAEGYALVFTDGDEDAGGPA